MHTQPLRKVIFLVLLTSLLVACASGSDGNDTVSSTRSFTMGFTPWPYAATIAAVNDTYTKINNNSDIIAHHIDRGIPWNEALNGDPYPAAVESEISAWLNNTPSGKKVYLAISPISSARDGLAGYWDDSGTNQTLTAPWSGYDFDNADVQNAYINFVTDLINRFNPAYFNFGIEASELILNDAINGTSHYTKFLTFASAVYTALHSSFPDLKLMISVALKSPGLADSQAIAAKLPDLIPYVDVVGASVYPYAFFEHANKGDPANLPGNWLSQLQAIAGSKPIAVTETGWIAERLKIGVYGLDVPATPANQNAYVQELFNEAQRLNAGFVIWFAVVDFDDLWNDPSMLNQSPLAQIWRDTGLYDGAVVARPALTTWQEQLAVTLSP